MSKTRTSFIVSSYRNELGINLLSLFAIANTKYWQNLSSSFVEQRSFYIRFLCSFIFSIMTCKRSIASIVSMVTTVKWIWLFIFRNLYLFNYEINLEEPFHLLCVKRKKKRRWTIKWWKRTQNSTKKVEHLAKSNLNIERDSGGTGIGTFLTRKEHMIGRFQCQKNSWFLI